MRILLVTLLALSAITMSAAEEKTFLESYGGQSTDELIALADSHRVDSIVSAFEQAIERKKEKKQKLSQVELDILAIEAMEREVNNGGYHQFFFNSSKEYAAILPAALKRIGCPKAAQISSEALSYLGIKGDVTSDKITSSLETLGEKAIDDLARIDERYFKNDEAIADKSFAYIKSEKSEIILK